MFFYSFLQLWAETQSNPEAVSSQPASPDEVLTMLNTITPSIEL
jgi:hypothetical protein